MKINRILYCARILLGVSLSLSMSPVPTQGQATQHLLYVASPGVRNYVEYGGVGILVFDIDHEYKFIRRIPTWNVPDGEKPENVKGIVASAKTSRVYVTSLERTIAIDAISGKVAWDKAFEGGSDRLAISPDGKTAASVTSAGGWLDLAARKLVAPELHGRPR